MLHLLWWESSAESGAFSSSSRCVYLFTASYGVSYGPIGWVLPSEVFPQSVRSKGVALSTASNWYVHLPCDCAHIHQDAPIGILIPPMRLAVFGVLG